MHRKSFMVADDLHEHSDSIRAAMGVAERLQVGSGNPQANERCRNHESPTVRDAGRGLDDAGRLGDRTREPLVTNEPRR